MSAYIREVLFINGDDGNAMANRINRQPLGIYCNVFDGKWRDYLKFCGTNHGGVDFGVPEYVAQWEEDMKHVVDAGAKGYVVRHGCLTERADMQPPEMTGGNFSGQQPGGFQQTWESASSASEIVNGTMTNSAASLEADYANASYITVTDDDSQVKISSSGTYVVTGESSDGNITVKKGTTGVVLVLDNLDLTSTTGAAVSINKEAEVKVIISGNVVLTDNENPDDENSEDADVADAFDGAAFKTKANSQVYVTGDGTLTINGNAKNGIKAGDDSSLIFDGVTVNINAVNDGINGNYDVTLLSGNFTIEAGDDAIHADHILTVGSTDGSGPTIRVTGSNEGLEGTVVNILGGDVSIVSKDDAINAANGDGLYEGVLDYSFNMTGGRVLINSQSDGVDSNGNINLMGGSMEIHSASMGGEAGLDYDGQLYIADDFSMNNQSGVALTQKSCHSKRLMIKWGHAVRHTINLFDYVLDVQAEDEEGEALLAELDLRQVRHRRVDSAITSTVEQIKRRGFFDNPDASIFVSAHTRSDKHTDRLHRELETVVNRAAPPSAPEGTDHTAVPDTERMPVEPGTAPRPDTSGVQTPGENPFDGDLSLDTATATLSCTATGQSVRLGEKELRILEYMFLWVSG